MSDQGVHSTAALIVSICSAAVTLVGLAWTKALKMLSNNLIRINTSNYQRC